MRTHTYTDTHAPRAHAPTRTRTHCAHTRPHIHTRAHTRTHVKAHRAQQPCTPRSGARLLRRWSALRGAQLRSVATQQAATPLPQPLASHQKLLSHHSPHHREPLQPLQQQPLQQQQLCSASAPLGPEPPALHCSPQTPAQAVCVQQQAATPDRPFDRFMCRVLSPGQRHGPQVLPHSSPDHLQAPLQAGCEDRAGGQRAAPSAAATPPLPRVTHYLLARQALPVPALLHACLRVVLGAARVQPHPAWPAPRAVQAHPAEDGHPVTAPAAPCTRAGPGPLQDARAAPAAVRPLMDLVCGQPSLWWC